MRFGPTTWWRASAATSSSCCSSTLPTGASSTMSLSGSSTRSRRPSRSAARPPTSARASGSPPHRDQTTIPTRSSAMPTRRCTGRRSTGAAGTSSSDPTGAAPSTACSEPGLRTESTGAAPPRRVARPEPAGQRRSTSAGSIRLGRTMVAVHEAPVETSRDRWVLVAAIAVFVALFAFALAEYARVRWYPVLDDALTEMRVRSVFSAHPPLVGLPGRIGTPVHPGSHLGPISFYLLWPVYALFGSSSWSLQLATAVLHVVAI